jgi:hypothetical protein
MKIIIWYVRTFGAALTDKADCSIFYPRPKIASRGGYTNLSRIEFISALDERVDEERF